jgi:hypothetical protein
MGAITHAGLFAVLCVPHGSDIWDSNLMAKCATGAPVTVAVGVCILVVDLAIFILPFPIIVNLNMDKNKKRGLIIVFLIGFSYVELLHCSLLTDRELNILTTDIICSIIVTSAVGLSYRIIVLTSAEDPTWNGANVSITA